MNSSFSARTVLVTGATQNLGFTIAGLFADAGARVLLHGRDEAAAAEAVARLRAANGGRLIEPVCFDLADETAITGAFAGLESRGASPDVLVNNAADLGLGERGFLDEDAAFYRRVMEVNFFGALRCSQLAARGMKARGVAGAIVQISSLAGERPLHGRMAYGVSKAALDGLTRALALELAPLGIRVNAVAPGYVWTPRWDDLSESVVRRRLDNVPSGLSTAQREIADLVLFLASAAAPSLLGQIIRMDGGLGVQQLPRDIGV